ncbi:MAG TPA: Hsp20/alpha crystallin family protein [Myxococcota bacterium]|nr:Hsp20/alpha crystallin family protein [Myxococcota bacterium]
MANENPSQDLQLREKQELKHESTRPGLVFRPDVDILERPDAYVIYADLPGVDEKSVQVRVDNDLLTIDASLATLPGEGWTPVHIEYRFGHYHREFHLSDAIETSAVAATMRDGVLELRLPKVEKKRPRTIEVRAS